MYSRIDHFRGTEKAYMRYLEQVVLTLRSKFRISEVPASCHNDNENEHIPQQPITGNDFTFIEERPIPYNNRKRRRIASKPTPELTTEPTTTSPTPVATRTRTGTKTGPKPGPKAASKTVPGTASTAVPRTVPDTTPATGDKPRWQELADRIIVLTPEATLWKSSMQDQGLLDILCDGRAAEFLLSHGSTLLSELSKDQTELRKSHDFASRVLFLTEQVMTLESKTSRMSVLINYKKFLIMSMCAVLHDNSHASDDEVQEILQFFTRGPISHSYFSRMINAAKTMNRLLHRLSEQNWGTRASELLLLCCGLYPECICILIATGNQNPAFYSALTSASDRSFEYLASALGHEKYTRDFIEWPGRIPLNIPLQVYNLLETKVS